MKHSNLARSVNTFCSLGVPLSLSRRDSLTAYGFNVPLRCRLTVFEVFIGGIGRTRAENAVSAGAKPVMFAIGTL